MIKNLSGRSQQRIDTSAKWATINPVLLSGELGIESNTGLVKVGNGTSTWNNLDYINNTGLTTSGVVTASTSSDVTYLESTGAPIIIDTTIS